MTLRPSTPPPSVPAHRLCFWLKYPALAVIVVLSFVLLRGGTRFDPIVSDLFYHNGHWLWPKHNATLTFWLHEALKDVFIAAGCGCLLVVIAGRRIVRLQPYRDMALLVALSLMVTPMTIAFLKTQTQVFCPSQLVRYHGFMPDDYRRTVLTPTHRKQARCFPAAHPGPGFALFALGVGATSRRRKILGYAAGALAGTVLSIIQIGRGEHFLSHCLATALIAWSLAQILAHAITPVRRCLERHFAKERFCHVEKIAINQRSREKTNVYRTVSGKARQNV